MENDTKKPKPVRITYKIVKKPESPKKSEQTQGNLQYVAPKVSHKQKHVLVAFLEEQGKDGTELMYRTQRDGAEEEADRETMETVGGGLWREVAVMLNSARVGGCVMSPQEWKNYWLDLMESTEKLIARLQEKNPRFKMESLPQLHKRIHKLASGYSDNMGSDANALSWVNEDEANDRTPVGALIKELTDQMNCKDVAECNSQIDKATRSQGNFDAVYLEEVTDSNMEMENERSDEEDYSKPLHLTRSEKAANARKRKRPGDGDAGHDKNVMTINSKYQSTVNFLRLKQERLKVFLLEREIELRNTECTHRKQIHEAEMKRREMEMIHMDAMHNKILHMSHM